MITFADNTMLRDLATLRRECFDESDAYIRFYLSHRFAPGNTLVYTEQGRGIASLTLLPACVATPVRHFSAAYIYAVATLPAFRRRGIAATLLAKAEETLQARGVEAMILAPASDHLVEYYTRAGYRPCFGRKKTPLEPIAMPGTTHCSGIEAAPLHASDYLRLRDTAYASCGYFVRWDADALDYALRECETTGGMACRLCDGNDEGFFAAYLENDVVILKESWLTPRMKIHAATLIQRCFGYEKNITAYQPAALADKATEPFAMLKCLTPEALPAATALPYFGLALD
jgi:ribosomal protein S18 acetylase RimI-like enzyme